jgi:sortase A
MDVNGRKEIDPVCSRMKKQRRLVRALEVMLSAVAVLLLGTYVAAMTHRSVTSSRALRTFELANEKAKAVAVPASPALQMPTQVDVSLWSAKRVLAYAVRLTEWFDTPLGVLNVPRLNIRVPVFEGTDDLVLNRGVGWITGTARPGQAGNTGIAGHRDGFFRALKDIAVGDEIRMDTLRGVLRYKVDQLEVVTPDDVTVLHKRQAESITLVTCYPFYFMGDAPQRFIVHAVRQQDAVPR